MWFFIVITSNEDEILTKLDIVKPVILKTTDDFILRVGESVMNVNNKILCYQVVNRTYAVIESETTNSAKAGMMLLKAQEGMDKLREIIKDGADKHKED